MFAMCGYDCEVAIALDCRLINAGLVVNTIRYLAGNVRVQVGGLVLTDHAIHLLMTKSTGKTAHGILSAIEEEEACLTTPAHVRSS